MNKLPYYFVFFVITLLLAGCSKEEAVNRSQTVRVLEVHPEDLNNTLLFPARSRSADSVNLSFRVNGPLITLPVLVGQEVKKGDILAQVDPRDYRVQIQNIAGSILQIEANLRLAESEFQRFNSIYEKDKGAVSSLLVEQKKEAVSNIQGQLKSANATLENAKKALKDTFLRAPFNGTIVAVLVNNFEFVQGSQSILRLVSTEEIDVLIDVPDRIIASIKDSKNIRVKFDGVPNVSFSAIIIEIGTESSPTTRTFPVTLRVTPPEGTYLFPGMTGTAFLDQPRNSQSTEKSFKLPLSALFSLNGSTSFVYVADPGSWKISKKTVNILTLSHAYAVVTGLNDSDFVVISGVSLLNDNSQIIPLKMRMDPSGEIL